MITYNMLRQLPYAFPYAPVVLLSVPAQHHSLDITSILIASPSKRRCRRLFIHQNRRHDYEIFSNGQNILAYIADFLAATMG